jgi:hypothetical protein
MHESIPGVTIPPPRTPPGICPIDSSRGREFAFHICARGPGIGGPQGFDKWLPRIPPTNVKAAKPSFRHAGGCADRILRPCGQGGVKFIVRISENYTLCHANLNTTIKGLCFIIFHSSLIL